MEFQGKMAVVTGGSSGIGRGIAEALAQNGVDVVICGREEKTIVRAAMEISDKYKANCLGVPCDVRDRAGISQFMQMATESGTTNIDILVNNAGISAFAPIRELTEEVWDAAIDTNLTGAFNMTKAALPHMKAGSYIFNIASIAAVARIPGGAAYNAAKAGLLAFSEATMLDLRKEDIRVTCILPGSVNTRFEGPDGRSREDWKMEPEDIAKVVVDCLRFHPRALPSRIDLRPTRTS